MNTEAAEKEYTLEELKAIWSRKKNWAYKCPVYYTTPAELDALPEYSCSIPTGTTIGKMWKRDLNAFPPKELQPYKKEFGKHWMICRYDEHEDPKLVKISTFQVRFKGERIKALTVQV